MDSFLCEVDGRATSPPGGRWYKRDEGATFARLVINMGFGIHPLEYRGKWRSSRSRPDGPGTRIVPGESDVTEAFKSHFRTLSACGSTRYPSRFQWVTTTAAVVDMTMDFSGGTSVKDEKGFALLYLTLSQSIREFADDEKLGRKVRPPSGKTKFLQRSRPARGTRHFARTFIGLTLIL